LTQSERDFVYRKYLITQLGLKHNFHIFEDGIRHIKPDDYERWKANKKESIEIVYLWRNDPILTYTEFYNCPAEYKHWYLICKPTLTLIK